MKKLFFYLFLFSSILLITCQKEVSYETGGVPSRGSLVDDGSGDCLPKTVNGTYMAGTALSTSANTIQVSVNVTKTGSYTILSDTVNGYYFKAAGIFSTLGSNSVTLKGFGTPAASGTNNFLLQYDSTACNVAVTVLPAGTGPATFTIESSGSPASCTGATPAGNYIVGTALNSSNTVTLNVNVTAVGTYNVTTAAVSGMTFSANSSFATTGSQLLVLTGSGTPTGSAGTVTIPVTAGSTTCSFQVNVTNGAVGTLGGAGGTCTPITPNGTYTQGIALTASNTVQVQINVTTVGPYNISTNTVSGFSFAGSGTAIMGTQLVTLSGTGTPTASGPILFSVTFGTSTCTFTVTVNPSSGGAATFTVDCSTAIIDPDALFEATLQLNCSNKVAIDVNVTALGTYSITTTPTNGMTFSASGTFTTLGVQTITLTGTGTPTAGGIFNIPVNITPSCSFSLTVEPPTTDVGWSFTVTNAPATTYKGQADDEIMVPFPPLVGFVFLGSNSYGTDNFQFALQDANGTIAVGETYSTSAMTGNLATFQYDLATSPYCSNTYKADPSVSGATIIFTITAHNPATMVISGTFTGTAKNSANQTITITSGTFTTQFNPYHF